MPARIDAEALTALRFGLVGVLNTLCGLAVIYALKWTFGLHDVAANVAGYSVGLVVSYLLNARWTFKYRGSLLAAAHRFLLSVGIAYLANLATVATAIYVLGVNSYAAHAIGVIPYALLTFLASKFFVFRQPAEAGPEHSRPATR